jgi:hypothetical protein
MDKTLYIPYTPPIVKEYDLHFTCGLLQWQSKNGFHLPIVFMVMGPIVDPHTEQLKIKLGRPFLVVSIRLTMV